MEEVFNKYLKNYHTSSDSYQERKTFKYSGRFYNGRPVYCLEKYSYVNRKKTGTIFEFNRYKERWDCYNEFGVPCYITSSSNIWFVSTSYAREINILDSPITIYEDRISKSLKYFNYKQGIDFGNHVMYYILGFKKFEIPKEMYEIILSCVLIIEINNSI